MIDSAAAIFPGISQGVLTSGLVSFFMGGLAGYATKKVAKIIAVLAGIFILALGVLEYNKLINVNWDNVKNAGVNITHSIYTQGLAVEHHIAGAVDTSTIGAAGLGFIGGFALGFHKG